MLRAAAKNFQDVVVISDVADYEAVMDEIKKLGCKLCFRKKWQEKYLTYECI